MEELAVKRNLTASGTIHLGGNGGDQGVTWANGIVHSGGGVGGPHDVGIAEQQSKKKPTLQPSGRILTGREWWGE